MSDGKSKAGKGANDNRKRINQVRRISNPRKAAVEMLVKISRDKSYSSLVLNNVLESTEESEKAFISRMVYGVIERQITLDFLLDKFIKDKSRVSIENRNILRLGAYQLLYMDNVPKFAAINETVELVEVFAKGNAKSLKGFVNGVLREVERNRENGALFDGVPDGLAGVSIKESFPFHLLNMWEKAYGADSAYSGVYGKPDFVEDLAKSLNEEAPTYIRVNSGLVSDVEFEEKMNDFGVNYEKHHFLPFCYRVFDIKSLKQLAQFHKNWYYHQDTASQIACHTLEAQPEDRIADVCAAPGGKSFTAALNMGDSGFIYSADIHRFKCDEMEKRAEALGIKSVEVALHDATQPYEEKYLASFDKVICDVPCSGLGAIRRKPEIKYKALDSFKGLPQLQLEILSNAAKLVRPGGVIQYSTCTLNLKENEQIVERFLSENDDFKAENLNIYEKFGMIDSCDLYHNFYGITLFPNIHQTDGFYIAKLRRNG